MGPNLPKNYFVLTVDTENGQDRQTRNYFEPKIHFNSSNKTLFLFQFRLDANQRQNNFQCTAKASVKVGRQCLASRVQNTFYLHGALYHEEV